MNKLKSLIFTAFLLITLLLPQTQAANNTRNDLYIIPETREKTEEIREIITDIWQITASGSVIDRYNAKAEEIDKKGDLGTAFSTGVFTRTTILNYLSYLMKFLSQLGLLIWGIMVVWAGYQYATVIFGTGSTNEAKAAISYAIKGILVIIFSYAIFRALTSMFIQ